MEYHWNDLTRYHNTRGNNGILRVLTWNAEGLRSAMDLVPENLFNKYDVVILTETFLRTEWNTEHFNAIHSFATQGPKGRPKGGITCFIKARLSPFKILSKSNNILVIQTKLCNIIAAYFQTDYDEEDLIDKVTAALNLIPRRDTVVMAGDLNCRIDKNHPKAVRLLEAFQKVGLSLINDEEEKTYIVPN